MASHSHLARWCAHGIRSPTTRRSSSAGWPRSTLDFFGSTDHEIGRLLDYLEDSGQLENTIVVVVSDNGASGEGGPNGSVNENKFFNGCARHDRGEHQVPRRARLARRPTTTTRSAGRGVQHAEQDVEALGIYEGGIADPFIIAWPKGIKGARRDPPPVLSTPSTSSRPSMSAWASPHQRWSMDSPRRPSRA